MKRYWRRLLVLLGVIAGFLCFIWPTPYEYRTMHYAWAPENPYVQARTNRLTGRSELCFDPPSISPDPMTGDLWTTDETWYPDNGYVALYLAELERAEAALAQVRETQPTLPGLNDAESDLSDLKTRAKLK